MKQEPKAAARKRPVAGQGGRCHIRYVVDTTSDNPGLPHRPVQRLTQPERLHPHRLTRQHPPVMINHRDRLPSSARPIPITAPSRGTIPRNRSRRAFRRRSPRVIPLPLPIRTSSLDAFGTPSPYYRTRRTSPTQLNPSKRAPPGLRPITTSYYYASTTHLKRSVKLPGRHPKADLRYRRQCARGHSLL